MRRIKTSSKRKNRRGISAVISNLILMAGVIAVGFVILAWSQGEASIYGNQYSDQIRSDTAKLRERVVFEYIHYDSSGLKVYLMNSGTIGGITIENVYIDGIPHGNQTLYFLDDVRAISLNATQQCYFLIAPLNLTSGINDHTIVVTTGRGSGFAATFACNC